ncbi:MAG TPA: ATP-binding protein, partial [Blastocatellia bacterium]|nr:ATP-binding protein [Blastocatellia bacterium]
MENPFRFGGELDKDELVDRHDELEQVIDTIRRGEKLFLIGPRRYGKTSILHAASQICREEGALVFRYNCEAFPTLRDLIERLFRDATSSLISPTTKAANSIRSLFTHLKPEISVNLLEQSVSASIGVKEEKDAAHLPLLVDALHGIEALAKKSRQPVAIFLDEFQHLIELGGETAERQLRAAVQEHRKVAYVFAGSKTRLLTEMVSDHGRPFYRLGARRFLGIIPRPEFISWLEAQFEKGRFTAPAENLTLLLNAAEDVPYDIQRLASTCWSIMSGQKLKKLTPELIAQA